MYGRMDSKTVVAAGFPAASANVAPCQFHPVPGCLTGLREQFREHTTTEAPSVTSSWGRLTERSLSRTPSCSTCPSFLSTAASIGLGFCHQGLGVELVRGDHRTLDRFLVRQTPPAAKPQVGGAMTFLTSQNECSTFLPGCRWFLAFHGLRRPEDGQ